MSIVRTIIGSAICLCFVGIAVGAKPEDDPRWRTASVLQDQGDYIGAAELFRQLFGDYPDSQRAALRIAINEDKAGNSSEAHVCYDIADAVQPFGYWAEVGLFYKAELYDTQNDSVGAQACVDKLCSRFPDSRWMTRGKVLLAKRGGYRLSPNKGLSPEDELADELEAWERFKSVHGGYKRSSKDDGRLVVLNEIISKFPNTGTSLQAYEMKGHILIRDKQWDDAERAFQAIVDRVGMDAPRSRVVMTAKSRLAGLYHAAGKKQEALTIFDSLANDAADPAVASNAALQAAGLFFELQQPKQWRREKIDSTKWDELRLRCEAVKSMDAVKPVEVARADIMIMESYLWEYRPEDCLEKAEVFLDSEKTESPVEFRREKATAHLFAGESLLRLHRAQEALEHFQWIAKELEDNGQIWPWEYLNARTYYRIYDALSRIGASDTEVNRAAEYVLANYPGTPDAELVRTALSQEENPRDGLKESGTGIRITDAVSTETSKEK